MSDYIEFLARIKTFSYDKWTLRSSKITPYHLASWGFNCIAEDTFECCMCQQRISAAHLPFQSEAEEQGTIDVDLLVKNFFGSIINVHKEECLYNQSNHNNSVFFTLNDEFLNQNMEQLYSISFNTYETLDNQNESEGQNNIAETFKPKYPLLDISFLKIIVRKTLATFAWRYEEIGQSNERTLSCDFCGRSVLLKNYSSSSSRYMKITQPSNKQELFNPFEEHKYFCKWSSALITNELMSETPEESQKKNNEKEDQKEIFSLKSINGWNICINYLLDQFTYQSKKKKTFETVSEIHKMQDEIKKLQTDFKQFESTIDEKYSKIINECDTLNIKSVGTSSSFKQKLQQNRQSIDEILKDLNLSNLISDQNKKVKTN